MRRLGGTTSSWNEVPPRSLLAGNHAHQPGVLSRDGQAIVDDTEGVQLEEVRRGSIFVDQVGLDDRERANVTMISLERHRRFLHD